MVLKTHELHFSQEIKQQKHAPFYFMLIALNGKREIDWERSRINVLYGYWQQFSSEKNKQNNFTIENS